MTANAKLYQFKIDTPFNKDFFVIVKSLETDARADAYTIAFREFTRIARIVSEGKKLARLPKDATPVKGATSLHDGQWAWVVAK
jgi:hypothetical protein